jgi:hypothetical protein
MDMVFILNLSVYVLVSGKDSVIVLLKNLGLIFHSTDLTLGQ